MCLSNFDRIREATNKERENELRCLRCGRGTIIVHSTAGRFMIQCWVCSRSVFENDFEAARAVWLNLKAA